MRRIEAIIRKYVPDAEVGIFRSNRFYAYTHIEGNKVIIEFSKRLVESGTWEQIEDTIAHEIAHVLQADREDKSAANYNWHTEEWSDIARALGSDITMPPFRNVNEPQRYKYRCADCGYTTNVSEVRHKALAILHRDKMPMLSSDVTRHGTTTGHHKWYVLDELTGRRWTETL
jgi:GAF domain-containing protein